MSTVTLVFFFSPSLFFGDMTLMAFMYRVEGVGVGRGVGRPGADSSFARGLGLRSAAAAARTRRKHFLWSSALKEHLCECHPVVSARGVGFGGGGVGLKRKRTDGGVRC